jgi:hypothetical protein
LGGRQKSPPSGVRGPASEDISPARCLASVPHLQTDALAPFLGCTGKNSPPPSWRRQKSPLRPPWRRQKSLFPRPHAGAWERDKRPAKISSRNSRSQHKLQQTGKLTFSKRRISAILRLSVEHRLRRAWNAHRDFRILPQPGFEAPNPSQQQQTMMARATSPARVRVDGPAARLQPTQVPRAVTPRK